MPRERHYHSDERLQCQEYANANKELKRNIKTGKKNSINGLAEVAEEAAWSGHITQLHDTTRKLSGIYMEDQRDC